jgi:hypothetical protein
MDTKIALSFPAVSFVSFVVNGISGFTSAPINGTIASDSGG